MATRDEDRKRLQAELAALDAADAEEEVEHTYEIGRGTSYARVGSKSPYGKKVGTFFKNDLGIDLDDEPVQDDDEADADEGKGKAKPGRQQEKGGTVKAFQRRIS